MTGHLCEHVIANGWNTDVQVVLALAQIGNQRLYRTQFFTFQEYCREKWAYGRNYVDKLISAPQVFTRLLTIVSQSRRSPNARRKFGRSLALTKDQATESPWLSNV